MKKVVAFLVPALLVALSAVAQAAPNAIDLAWTLPTTAVDGSPLTGNQALQNIQVFVSTASIPDTSTMTPTATLTATATTSTQTITAAPGQQVFVRLKACNIAGCSAFTTEVSKVIPMSVPNVPTSVTITLRTVP